MSSEPIHLIATATLQDGKLQETLDALKILTEEAHKNEPDLLRYFCFTTKNEKGQDQVVFIEKYANKEAHKVHRDTAHFQAFGKKIAGLVTGPPEIKVGSFVAGFEDRSKL